MNRNVIRRAGALPLGAAALLGSVALPATAFAQPRADEAALEEVVVTAEKRAEGLQNIPIAITAISETTLQRAGAKEVGDLVQLTPSLQFGTRSTNVFIAMRGIGQAGQDIGSQSGVTVSLDGVPLLNHFMMNPAFLDLERVEVLRGPQGTIAGRNATGGAINIHSKAPAPGRRRQPQRHRRRPVPPGRPRAPQRGVLRPARRPAVVSARGGGRLAEERLPRATERQHRRRRGARATAVHADGSFSLRGLVDYTRDRSDPGFAQILGRADPARPTVPELPTYIYTRNDPENLTFYFNEPNRRDVESIRATAIATWAITPDMTLTSTTGFIDHEIDLTDLDVDATPYNTSRFDLIGIYARQVTQELTLTADLGERADLVAGAFYMRGESSEPLYLSLAAFRNYLVYLPEETLDSYAAYAQFRYQVTDKLRATVGGRYTTDDKSYQMDSSVGGVPRLSSDSGKFSAFTPRFVLDYTPTEETLVYASISRGFKSGGFNTLGDVSMPVNRFNPEYVWNYEAGLKAMMFDRKVRLGLTGFYADYTNLQQTVFRLNEATQVRFPRVENSTSATIKGIEFEGEANPINGLRFTGAVTYLDAGFGFFCNNDPLYPTQPTSPSCVGETRDGQPLPPGAVQLEGNTLTQAPRWQYNLSAQYTVPVSDNLNLTARADYKWQSRTYFDIYNNPQNSQAAYGLLNGSVELASRDRAWALLAWIRNAADERYISQGSAGSGATPAVTGSMGLPRMYGVTITHQF
ncbi:TonB-dependent receptor [Phenylobacterium sp. J367]|uniref:TonB-dependent receptor n=1 Tax=Phenylobacterium sp. J367 TaxID=2898435 RepID=UPI00215077F5|nr:TonB-dependent receptor [Phenylobacterium sp. J367]MCR5879242.1 TonB-dependent receptor [Phenylobacterium sp. J367]